MVIAGAAYWWEVRVDDPIISPDVLGNLYIRRGCTINMLLFMALAGSYLLLPYYLELEKGYSAMEYGFILIANTAGMLLAGPLVGKLTDRTGENRKFVLIGSFVCAMGFFMMMRFDESSGLWWILLSLVVMGIGIGMDEDGVGPLGIRMPEVGIFPVDIALSLRELQGCVRLKQDIGRKGPRGVCQGLDPPAVDVFDDAFVSQQGQGDGRMGVRDDDVCPKDFLPGFNGGDLPFREAQAGHFRSGADRSAPGFDVPDESFYENPAAAGQFPGAPDKRPVNLGKDVERKGGCILVEPHRTAG